MRREFIGFNRARHAVLEAAIYATRLHLLPRETIEGEFERLQVIVDKTAGDAEREAMSLLTEFIRTASASRPGPVGPGEPGSPGPGGTTHETSAVRP